MFDAEREDTWVLFDGEWAIAVVADDIGRPVAVLADSSLLFIDICLDVCFVRGESAFCFDVELLLVVVVDVDDRAFWDTIAEYCSTG